MAQVSFEDGATAFHGPEVAAWDGTKTYPMDAVPEGVRIEPVILLHCEIA